MNQVDKRKKIRLQVELDYGTVVNRGIRETLEGIRLEGSGKVIVPIHLEDGLSIGNPAPSGTWEVIE